MSARRGASVAGMLYVENRAGMDRRATVSPFRYPERRTGFDRRSLPWPTLFSVTERGLRELRDNPLTLVAVLLALNALNLLDYLATVRALSHGMAEGNPVMASLFAYDYGAAALAKVMLVGMVSAIIWQARRFRVVLGAAMLSFTVYASLFVYHLFGSTYGYL